MPALHGDQMNGQTLLIDLETSPNIVATFELRNAFIGINQIIEPSRVTCFTAKWYGKPKVTFRSVYHHGREAMLETLHAQLDEADVAMHYNGKRFDEQKVRGELYLEHFMPPAPFQRIDLWETVKGFGLPSSKLDYVLGASGLPKKLQTGGMELWIACMNGDPKAWARMKRYNIQDVRAMEPLYDRMRPWIVKHPSAVLNGELAGRVCGSERVQKRGLQSTRQSTFQRFQCQDCGSWSRATHRESGAVLSDAVA